MNIKKMFTTLSAMVVAVMFTLPNASVFAASYSQELQDAYNWAYSKGVTTMSPIDNANMYGAITRAEMAKMLSVYATEVLGMTPDTSAACTFSDIASVKGDLHDYIIESCQLGIMGQGITEFRPYDTISRAEFGTALSRVLWGSQYENATTPYYAKHLDALKAAGIMTQISNAESTKEIRGYVMLMLMRSEGNDAVVDCDDPMTVIACTTDTDACPAACREGSDEPIVVKAGDLTVTAKAAEGRRAVNPGVSDLDTLTFRTSEEVTISKVVLERYGYSTQDDVDAVWLEDQDGNIIAEEKSLNKDKVTLSLKKDYRTVDGAYYATVVVRLTGDKVGGTIGFKVVDAESTAKNLNLDNYTPYTYEMVQYDGNAVTVDIKGTQDKNYNYVEGESYEIARLKVTAGSGVIYLRGFTLTNGGELDMPEFLDKLTVKVDGEEVDGLKYSFNKEDQLVISFDEMTIDMKKSKLFVIYASLADFDDYGEYVAYFLEEKADINAVEKKTGARLDVNGKYDEDNAIRHAFNGGKIKLSNTKLGKLDASQGTEGFVIGEGNITLTEPIHKLAFTLNATGTSKAYVTRVAMFVNGEEYEAKKDGTAFKFSNVEIEKSGKIQFKIDIDDQEAAQSGTITLTPNFNGDLFTKAEYENARKETVKSGDVSGTISFSTVTVQAAKATFKNTLSKAVEFMNNDTNDGVVFDGTYTAKKANINLNKFYMSGAANGDKIKVTYYLYVEGKEVASVDAYGTGAEETFDDIAVKAGESVKVRVVAEVEAYGAAKTLSGVQVFLGGTDDFDKDVEYKGAKLVDLKIVDRGSVNLTAGDIAKTVLYKAKNKKIAEFTIKPANGSSSVEIETIVLTMSGITNSDDISVMFNKKTELEADSSSSFTYSDIGETITDPVVVQIILNEEYDTTVGVTEIRVNDKKLTKEFVTKFVNGLVTISNSRSLGGGTTKFNFAVEKDDDVIINGLTLSFETEGANGVNPDVAKNDVSDSTTMEVTNASRSDIKVASISYNVCPSSVDMTNGECAGAKEEVVMETQPTDADACTGAGGTWAPNTETEDDDTDGTCTGAKEEVEMETQPTSQNACVNAGGQWTVEGEDECEPVSITRDEFPDFFMLDGRYVVAYANSNSN